MKWVKRLSISFVVLIVLVIAAIVVVSLLVDPNEYKPRIAEVVQERYARTLTMDGPIALTFFPRLGASISKVTLSEARSTNNFAKIGAVHVSVAMLPLLSRKLVVDRIELRDIEANLVKKADGSTNFDDLAGAEKPAPASAPSAGGDAAPGPVAIDISGVRIANLAIGWKDEANKTDIRLLDVNLELGRITSGVTGKLSFSARAEGKQSKLDARLQVAGTYRLALDTVPGRKVEFPELNITVTLTEGKFSVQGSVGTAMVVELDAKTIGLAKIVSNITATGAAIPNGAVKVTTSGNVNVNWEKRTLATDLTVKFDESTLRLNVSVADYAKPDPRFKVDIDRLNVDRYTGKGKTAAPKPAPGSADRKGDGADTPIDLSALKALNGAGSIHIGSLVAANVKSERIDVEVKAVGGDIHLDPIKAQLYSGSVVGAINVDARTNRIAVRQQLAGVAVGPLLRDGAAVDMLEGRGNVGIDITTIGRSVGEMKRALNGKAQLDLQDGALKGLNLADIARRARALRSGEVSNAAATEKTDFSELTASFLIRDGIAANDDLSMKSPFVRVTGAGRIDIPAGSIDYLAKPALTATTTGQGGRSTDEVRAITIPVKIAGPFDQLRYSIELGSVARDAAKEALQRQLEQRAKGVLEGAGKERIGDVLKGILGR
jgi:AsmA protein